MSLGRWPVVVGRPAGQMLVCCIGSRQGTEGPSRSCPYTRDVKDYESDVFRPAGWAAGGHYFGHPEPFHGLSITALSSREMTQAAAGGTHRARDVANVH